MPAVSFWRARFKDRSLTADQSGGNTDFLEGKFRLHETDYKNRQLSKLAQLTLIYQMHCNSERSSSLKGFILPPRSPAALEDLYHLQIDSILELLIKTLVMHIFVLRSYLMCCGIF